MEEVTYRWIDPPQTAMDPGENAADWERLAELIGANGWMTLNPATSRALISEDSDANIVGFLIFQMIPYVGPLYCAPSMRGQGIAEEMSDRMIAFLEDIKARGWTATAENPHAEKIMVDRGMKKVDAPLYVMRGPVGGIEV